jgi:hypothetical protein
MRWYFAIFPSPFIWSSRDILGRKPANLRHIFRKRLALHSLSTPRTISPSFPHFLQIPLSTHFGFREHNLESQKATDSGVFLDALQAQDSCPALRDRIRTLHSINLVNCKLLL